MHESKELQKVKYVEILIKLAKNVAKELKKLKKFTPSSVYEQVAPFVVMYRRSQRYNVPLDSIHESRCVTLRHVIARKRVADRKLAAATAHSQ